MATAEGDSCEANPMNQIEEKALIVLEKVHYINQIFYQDYFSNNDNLTKYNNNMISINNQ